MQKAFAFLTEFSRAVLRLIFGENYFVAQLERNVTELQVTVDDYHDQLQRSKVKSGGPGDNNYRQMMIEKEVEYSKLLDDFQVSNLERTHNLYNNSNS